MYHAVCDELAHNQSDVVSQRLGEPIRQGRADVVARDSRCVSIGRDFERNWEKRLDTSEMPVDAQVKRARRARCGAR